MFPNTQLPSSGSMACAMVPFALKQDTMLATPYGRRDCGALSNHHTEVLLGTNLLVIANRFITFVL